MPHKQMLRLMQKYRDSESAAPSYAVLVEAIAIGTFFDLPKDQYKTLREALDMAVRKLVPELEEGSLSESQEQAMQSEKESKEY